MVDHNDYRYRRGMIHGPSNSSNGTAWEVVNTDEISGDDDDDGPDPTHECIVCGYETHVESAPSSTYQWCPICERVQRFRRLDRQS